MTEYIINTDISHGPLEQIDVGRLATECEHPWFNQTLCQVNDAVVRLGVLHGEFHWHAHDQEDELFYVVEGRLTIELRGENIELGPRQAVVIPKGVEHRPLAPERTVVLMVETATVSPTGDGSSP